MGGLDIILKVKGATENSLYTCIAMTMFAWTLIKKPLTFHKSNIFYF